MESVSQSIGRLIERSSFGTTGAKRLRARTTAEAKAAIRVQMDLHQRGATKTGGRHIGAIKTKDHPSAPGGRG